jgi:hypothetical protein
LHHQPKQLDRRHWNSQLCLTPRCP